MLGMCVPMTSYASTLIPAQGNLCSVTSKLIGSYSLPLVTSTNISDDVIGVKYRFSSVKKSSNIQPAAKIDITAPIRVGSARFYGTFLYTSSSLIFFATVSLNIILF